MTQWCLELLGKEIDLNDSKSTRIIFCWTATKSENKKVKNVEEYFLSVLNTNVPLKTRYIQRNQPLFVNKEIQRAATIMTNSRNLLRVDP